MGSKEELLSRLAWTGNDEEGYKLADQIIKEDDLNQASSGLVNSLTELQDMIDNDEDITDIHNYLIGYILQGGGDNWSGSYYSEKTDKETEWLLMFGQIVIDKKNNQLIYRQLNLTK